MDRNQGPGEDSVGLYVLKPEGVKVGIYVMETVDHAVGQIWFGAVSAFSVDFKNKVIKA